MKHRHQNGILLLGGLGNQLFQFAAAQYLDNTRRTLDDSHNLSRRNRADGPDISSLTFEYPPTITAESNYPRILIRAENFFIRLSAKSTPKALIKVVEALASILFSTRTLSFTQVRINQGIGYDASIKPKRRAKFFGYFQNSVYVEKSEIFKNMMTLEPKNPSSKYFEYVNRAKSLKPLVVHIRLGDYKLENSFGIPSNEYFTQAILAHVSQKPNTPIWLFSDEPNLALTKIPKNFQDRIELIDCEMASGETLDLMRHGSGYVISNSTFSWWAAFLRFDRGATVIAPTPWFKSSSSPSRLIPEGWQRIDANYP